MKRYETRKGLTDQIRDDLLGLSIEQMRTFAWLCAVRALPFLGAEGNFNFWNKNEDRRQKYLFSVFNALDSNAARVNTARADIARINASIAANAATDSAYDVAITAGHAANASFVASAAAAAATYAISAAARYEVELKPIIQKDMGLIRVNNNIFHNDIKIYGHIWNKFLKALRDLDCGYWGEWYAELFAKRFSLDNDDLVDIKMRLSVPNEIMEQGAAAVVRRVADIKKWGAEQLNEARVLILGEKGSGKTSLARRLKSPTYPMPGDNDSTEGVDVVDWNIPKDGENPNGEVNVHIWDFAGHVITHAAHRCFMSERCLYILLINGRTEGDNRTEYWLEQIRNYGGNSPVLILVNKRDDHRFDIPENTLKKAFPAILGFHQVNINTGGEPLKRFRKTVMKHLRDNPLWKNQIIAAPAYKVKESLRLQFAQGSEYITYDEFNKIAEVNKIAPDERKQLLEDLRALGICLWYDTGDMREFDTMVLNPSWITHGIYRLINWGLSNKKHILSISDFHKVFTGVDVERYPVEKAEFLFRLMKTYQLAFFKVKDAKKIFVPLLLPADRTDSVLLPEYPFGNRLRMEYRANQSLPPYTVARLAVLHSDELDEKNSWRFGAVLQWGKSTALVEEDERTRSVTVCVRGAKQTDYISRLRYTLDSIFDDYKSSRPELKYEVLLPDEQVSNISHQLLTPNDYNRFMQPEEQIAGNANVGQMLFVGGPNASLVDPMPTMNAYKIEFCIKSNALFGNNTDDTNGSHLNPICEKIEFKDSFVGLQGVVCLLSQCFRAIDNPKASKLVVLFESVTMELNNAETELLADNIQEPSKMRVIGNALRKRGRLFWLERLRNRFCDEKSDLQKLAIEIGDESEMLHGLVTYYNEVAQRLTLPLILNSVFND
jgi:GTPase SAR1 family protein